ncbi:Hypothetical protein POVN_LOCUS308 [uncultured virus]|nr:Hypothetical protein POVN_LOCUS308 [uncultured virus]
MWITLFVFALGICVGYWRAKNTHILMTTVLQGVLGLLPGITKFVTAVAPLLRKSAPADPKNTITIRGQFAIVDVRYNGVESAVVLPIQRVEGRWSVKAWSIGADAKETSIHLYVRCSMEQTCILGLPTSAAAYHVEAIRLSFTPSPPTGPVYECTFRGQEPVTFTFLDAAQPAPLEALD